VDVTLQHTKCWLNSAQQGWVTFKCNNHSNGGLPSQSLCCPLSGERWSHCFQTECASNSVLFKFCFGWSLPAIYCIYPVQPL